MTEEKQRGFSMIYNDILQILSKAKMNGSQFRLIHTVWRYTYGFQRVDHDFSVGYLQKETGLSDRAIKKELNFLIDTNVLMVTEKETRTTPRKLKFNDNFTTWKLDTLGIVGNNHSPLENEADEQLFTTVVNNYSPQDENEWVTTVHPIKESNNNLNKGIKETIYSSFEQFYSIYPRKKAKETARKAWIKLAKDKSFNAELIINNTLNYAETCREIKQDIKFIPFPATYLNQQRYEDYEVINPEGINAANSGQGSSLAEKNQQLLREIGGDLFSEDRRREEIIPNYIELLPEV